MKVLQINAVYGTGSTGTIVRDLQRSCAENDIACYVAYAKASDDVSGGFKIGSKIENFLHAVLCRLAGKQAYFSVFATKRLLHYMDNLNPDVVHLHNLHSNFINLKVLLKYLAQKNIRTVITLHDCWWYTGGCFHYTTVKCSKWRTGCGHCPKRFRDSTALFYDASRQLWSDRKKYLSAINNLTIVGVSDWITEEARQSFLASNEIRTICNGIDFTKFKPINSDLRARLKLDGRYVMMGPVSKWMLEINKPVLEYFQEQMKGNMVLVLIGADRDGWMNNDPQTGVLLYHYVDKPEELAQLYTMADVFVNCTREESLGLMNIEAQACGTPVVSFSSTGVSETILPGNKVQPGDCRSLFEKSLKPVPVNTDFLSRFDAVSAYPSYISLYRQLMC